MWRTDTLWFDAAVVLGIFAFGNIGFGHFEEHKPKWRRLLKVVLVLAIMLTLSATAGRVWAYTFLALPLIGAAVVHLWWASQERRQRLDRRAQGALLPIDRPYAAAVSAVP